MKGLSTNQVSDANGALPRRTLYISTVTANALRDAQPMQTNKRIIDMIGALQTENQMCRDMLHRLEAGIR
jgi:hypothetical protein